MTRKRIDLLKEASRLVEIAMNDDHTAEDEFFQLHRVRDAIDDARSDLEYDLYLRAQYAAIRRFERRKVRS